MQIEREKVLQCVRSGTSVYLHGPIGSGKTYIMRSLADDVVKMNGWSKTFIIYEGFVTELRDYKRSIKSSINEAFYTRRGAPMGWQPQHEATTKMKLPEGDWQVLYRPLKNRSYKLVIILDDYELWRSNRSDEEFARLRELQRLGVVFMIIGREKLANVNANEQEGDFLEQFIPISMYLPSEEEARYIAKTCLQGRVSTKISSLLEDDHYERMVDISGSYPYLLDCLTCALAQIINILWTDDVKLNDLSAKIHHLVEDAAKQIDFIRCVKCLWELLSESEKQVLAIVAIAQKSDPSLHEVYTLLARRYSGEVHLGASLDAELNRLKDERLLLSVRDKKYMIPAIAIVDYVLEQDITNTLQEKSGIRIEKIPYSFDQIKFLWFWLFGAFGYIILLLMQPILSNWILSLLGFVPPGVLLLPWIPALLYMVVYAIRRVSSRANHYS